MLDDTDYDFSDPDLFEHRYKDTHAQHRAEADMLRGGKVGSAGNHQGGIGSGKGSDSGGRHDGASKVAGGGGGSNGGRNSGGKCTPVRVLRSRAACRWWAVHRMLHTGCVQ